MYIFSFQTASLVAVVGAAISTIAHPLVVKDEFVTIPLVPARVDAAGGSSVPATIIHQQNVNQGIARLHKAQGRDLSLDIHLQLAHNLQERVAGLPENLQKRYSHISVDQTLASFNQFSDGSNAPSALKAAGSTASKQSSVTESKVSSFNHSILLSIQSHDMGWKIQIGTPPRDFLLLMDSGSSDLWVGSERCISDSASGQCGKHTYLGNSSSSTFNSTNEPWMIGYGTGQVFGSLATDVVSVAGMKLPKHKFGVATFESALFSGSDIVFDGILGLAKSQNSKQHTPTLLSSLFTSKLITSRIVSFKIPRSSGPNPDGEVAFGAMNPSKYDPAFVAVLPNVNKNGVWEAKIDKIAVAGKDAKLAGRTGVFDTGTSLILAPETDVQAIHKLIPNAKYVNETGWTVPCNMTTSFSLSFGNKEFPVEPRDIAWIPVDGSNNRQGGDCISGISVGGAGGDTWLIGDVFLKNVYLSTNEATDKISIAKLANRK